MSVEGSRSMRMAANLVTRAGRAFEQGETAVGQQLITEAARLYATAGEPRRAVELLEGSGLTNHEVSTVATAPMPVPPLADASDGASAEAARPASTSPPAVDMEDLVRDLEFDVSPPARVLREESTAPPVRWAPRTPHQRLGEAWALRRGRSPWREDVPVMLQEMWAARQLGADAYADHLLATIRMLDPEAANREPDPDADFEVAIESPVEAEVSWTGETASSVLAPAEGSRAEIDNAISALVGMDGGGSAPTDAVPLDFARRPPQRASDTQDLTGTVLRGRFRLERRVGRGAQAQVYLAQDQVLERAVAIKVLSQHLAEQPDALEGFLAEARMAARIHHPGCLAVFDFGSEGALTFLALEFFRGRSLRALLRGGRLEPFLAVHFARTLAEALAAVHAAGIVHRDVKPSNILVDRGGRAKLSDFGVSIALDAPFEAGLMVGTLRYMAPEQARGTRPDARSDLFALGAVLWEMLAGKPTFEPTVAALKARMGASPPPLPSDVEVPEELAVLLRRCLSPNLEERPPSAEQIAEDLDRIQPRLRRERR